MSEKYYGIFACGEGVIDWEQFETKAEAEAYVLGARRVLKEVDSSDGEMSADFYCAIASEDEPKEEE